MNLNDWTSLSKNQQHELIIKWYKKSLQSSEYHDMAEEAAAALKRELRSNPDVTNVRVGGGVVVYSDGPTTEWRELNLFVCTLVPESRQLEGLPATYYGFGVEVLNVRDMREEFLQTLKTVLKELKGLSEADALKFANEGRNEPLDESLCGGFLFTPVYSRGPETMALDAIIYDAKKSQSMAGIRYIDLLSGMRDIISEATEKAGALNFGHPDKVKNFDWKSVRIKVNDLLERASRSGSEFS